MQIKPIIGSVCLAVALVVSNQSYSQRWYRAEMVSVRGYNNNCDFVGNEEGEFEVRASDNNAFATWSFSGCMECDGDMNNPSGILCSRTNLIR